MGCCSGIVRTVMFVFNFACLAVGIVLIAVGTLFYVSIDAYNDLIDSIPGLNVVPSVSIAFGVIVFFISFLGCCGAMKNSSCMLIMYAIILIVMLIAQLAIGIYGLVYINDNEDTLRLNVTTELEKSFEQFRYTDEKAKTTQELFQSMQSEIECCGVKGPQDYAIILHWPTVGGGCCGTPEKFDCPISENKYGEGCSTKLFEVIKDAVNIVAIVVMVICAVELLGAIVAICLAKSK